MNKNQYQCTVHYRNQRTGEPQKDIVLFAELLRELGLSTSFSQILDASEALLHIDVLNRVVMYESLKCTLTRSPKEQEIFSEVFPAFWRKIVDGMLESREPQTGSNHESASKSEDQDQSKYFMLSGYSQLNAANRESGGKHASFSAIGASHSEATLNFEPLPKNIEQHVHTLVRLLQSRYSRRRTNSKKGDQIHFRNMFRDNMKYGGEPINFSWTSRKKRKVQIVTFCDVSTSMNPFTSFFLKFLHTLTQIVPNTETAIFNIKMEFISSFLRINSLDRALQNIHQVSTGLSGGTRIGESLLLFNQELKKRKMANHQTIAIILSDGWDVGEIPLLEREMRKLHRSVSRVIWLHPYANVPGFKPEVEGLRVSVPYIDDLLPFHEPSSIHTLVMHLKGIFKQTQYMR